MSYPVIAGHSHIISSSCKLSSKKIKMLLFDWINFSYYIPEDCLSTRRDSNWACVYIPRSCIYDRMQLAVMNFLNCRICLIKLKGVKKIIYYFNNFRANWFVVFFCVKNYTHSSITMSSSTLIYWSMYCMHFKIETLASNSVFWFWMKMELKSLELSLLFWKIFATVWRQEEVW